MFFSVFRFILFFSSIQYIFSFMNINNLNTRLIFRHYNHFSILHKTNLIMRSKQSNFDGFDNIGVNIKKIAPEYKPKTDNQKLYYDFLNDPKVPIVFGIGPAGCGKTLFACVTAIDELRKGTINKIILTRPIIPVEEEELGFLPGNLIHKMDPWTRPIFDIFLEFFQQRDLDTMLQSGVIEISPLAYMRGRTFKKSFIIADEMQNSTPNQMLMLTTRIGHKTKMAITGDLKQSDRCQSNGLFDFMNKYNNYRSLLNNNSTIGIEIVEMNHADIERSPIVSKILDIYKPIHINDNIIDKNNSTNNVVIDKKKNSTDYKFYNDNNDAALIPISHLSRYDYD